MATHPPAPDRRTAADGSPRERLARFVQRARERAEQARSQFAVHGIAYGAVNGLLALINLLTSPGFLWFLFPAAGWGIGLLHHFTEARSRAQEAREAAALPSAGKGELKLVRKLFRSRRGLRHHLSTTVGVSALLAGINLFLIPAAGPWLLIPIAALGGSLAIHAGTARERSRRLRAQLQHAGAAPGRRAADVAALEADEAGVPAAHAPLLAEAEELRAAILAELRDGGEDAARWRAALQPELATYTGHVSALLQERRDLERAAARVSAADATRQLDDLRGKVETARSDELRREYRHTAEQYEGQLKSLQDLQERIETIDLRAKSAVLALRQLALDVPRLRTTPAEEPAALLSLRDKAQDLTQYLDDLRAGREELEDAGLRVRAPLD